MGNRKMKKVKAKKRITKSEAMAFKKRWEIENAFEKEELRIISTDEKLEQLIMLMTSAKELGWTGVLEGETGEVRDRWNVLRKVYHV